MLTLHIEAETLTDLTSAAMAALGLLDKPKAAKPKAEKEPTPTPKEKDVPMPPNLPAPVAVLPKAEPGVPVMDVRKRFEALVSSQYDEALALLDNMGCKNFADVLKQGRTEELAKAIAAL